MTKLIRIGDGDFEVVGAASYEPAAQLPLSYASASRIAWDCSCPRCGGDAQVVTPAEDGACRYSCNLCGDFTVELTEGE